MDWFILPVLHPTPIFGKTRSTRVTMISPDCTKSDWIRVSPGERPLTPTVLLRPGIRPGGIWANALTRIDTTYTIDDNDSILVTIQTSSNPWVWNSKTNDIHAALLLDTGTVAKYFPACSALVQVQTPYVRTSVYYTCWQDSLANGSITDTKTHVPMTFEETIIPVGE
jgi:hypothetical protein